MISHRSFLFLQFFMEGFLFLLSNNILAIFSLKGRLESHHFGDWSCVQWHMLSGSTVQFLWLSVRYAMQQCILFLYAMQQCIICWFMVHNFTWAGIFLKDETFNIFDLFFLFNYYLISFDCCRFSLICCWRLPVLICLCGIEFSCLRF